jgi:hypothetical protein
LGKESESKQEVLNPRFSILFGVSKNGDECVYTLNKVPNETQRNYVAVEVKFSRNLSATLSSTLFLPERIYRTWSFFDSGPESLNPRPWRSFKYQVIFLFNVLFASSFSFPTLAGIRYGKRGSGNP